MSALLLIAAKYATPTGRIVGGWEYVWAAYIVTWIALSLYCVSLWLRWPKTVSPKEKS
ncbi:MAG TPA: hypothetical protein VH208_04525 [Myxococcaceae bacterium]|nr:hypothetical protein [Myxococcaceae bacterium]